VFFKILKKKGFENKKVSGKSKNLFVFFNINENRLMIELSLTWNFD